MIQKIKLLIIEDNNSLLKNYIDSIEVYNMKSPEIKFDYITASTLEEAFEVLKTDDYDGIIVDLKLEKNDEKGQGNQIINMVKEKMRFPVIVLSGYPDDLEDDSTNTLFQVHEKGELEFEEILNKFVALYKTGLTKLLGKKGAIDKHLTDIFWNHLSTSIDYWIEEAENSSDCEKILLRYTIAHLQEYLDLSDSGGFDRYHPSEIYIIPPIKRNIFTGDILRSVDNSRYYVILTPACDLAQAKAKDVVLGEILDKDMDYVKQLKRDLEGDDDIKKKDAENSLKNLIRNNHSLKYHYLPSTDRFKGGFVNFQKVHSFKYKDLNGNLDLWERVASMSSSFTKELIARFSYYYSRQGQPDLDIQKIYESLVE